MAEMYSFDWAIACMGVILLVGLVVALWMFGNIMRDKYND